MSTFEPVVVIDGEYDYTADVATETTTVENNTT